MRVYFVYLLFVLSIVPLSPLPTVVEPCLVGKDLKRNGGNVAIEGPSILWRGMIQYLSIIGCNL